jgi:hypothetical protein
MITYSVYRVVHLVGIFLLLVVLAGLAAAGGGARRGAAGAAPPPGGPLPRRLGMALHGIALFIVLLGGFGLMARMGIVHGMDWPAWVWAKVAVWLLLGAAVAIPSRKPEWGRALILALPVLAGLAGWLAIFKPI